MKSILINLYLWIFALVTIILIFPLYLATWTLTVIFDKKRIIVHYLTCLWGSLYTWANPWWRVRITNRENFKKGKPYIIICNHQSMLDIVVLFRLMTYFRWISKTEIFRVPVVGWIMYMNNYIHLKRVAQKSIFRMMEISRKALLSGIPVLIFPEGTRSASGELQQFKDGAFVLAVDTKTDILPLIITEDSGALSGSGIFMKSLLSINVTVLKEIPYSSFKNYGVKETKKMLYSLMNKELRKLKISDNQS
jgi:1-acyl-sn-glycerol-3-phosphate acyltransferase